MVGSAAPVPCWGPKAGEFGRWHLCAHGPGEASSLGRLCAGPARGCFGQRRQGRWAWTEEEEEKEEEEEEEEAEREIQQRMYHKTLVSLTCGADM